MEHFAKYSIGYTIKQIRREKMKPNIITISFKNTIEDIKLYSWIISKSSLSGFIKDVLRKEYEKENEKR